MAGVLQDMIIIVDVNGQTHNVSCSDNQDFLMKISNIVDCNFAIGFSRYIRKRNEYVPISLDETELEDGWRVKVETKALEEVRQDILGGGLLGVGGLSDVGGLAGGSGIEDGFLGSMASINPNCMFEDGSMQQQAPMEHTAVMMENQQCLPEPQALAPQALAPQALAPQALAPQALAPQAPATTLATSTAPVAALPKSIGRQSIVSIKRRPWPNQFEVDDRYLPPTLINKLDKMRQDGPTIHLPEKDIKDLVKGVVDYVYQVYTPKIKEDQIAQIICYLYQRWGQLKLIPYGGDSHVHNRNYWAKRIQNRFKNDRARNSEICEETARMKRELKNKSTLPQKCQARIACLGSYLPETLPAGETDESQKMHHGVIISECRKTKPDLRKVRTSMDATFFSRRQFVVVEKGKTVDVLSRYPCLVGVDFITQEMERIDKVLLLQRYKENIKKIVPILALNPTQKEKKNNKMKVFRDAVSNGEIEDDVGKEILALLVVPFQLQHDFNEFIAEDQGQAISHPCITYKPGVDWFLNCSVVVDNQKILSDSDLATALLVFVSSFYIFNLSYPKSIQSTCKFYAKFLLDLEQDKMDLKVTNLMLKIARCGSLSLS